MNLIFYIYFFIQLACQRVRKLIANKARILLTRLYFLQLSSLTTLLFYNYAVKLYIMILCTSGQVRFKPHLTSVIICKLLLNGASYDTKIGCIQFLWAEALNINFLFCYVQFLLHHQYFIFVKYSVLACMPRNFFMFKEVFGK